MGTPDIPPTNTSDLPDLPALESVSTRGQSATWLIVLAYGGFAVWQVFFIGMLFWRYRQFVGREGYVLTLVVIGLVVWLVVRMLTGYTSMSTDPNGLSMRGPLIRRFVPWIEVRDAFTRCRDNRTTLVLRTAARKYTVTPSALGSTEGECVVASGWQHLRRLGKSEGITLSDSILKLWQPIPDDVPTTADWGKPPRSSARIGAITSIAVPPVAVISLFLVAHKECLTILPLLVLMSFALEKWLILPNLRRVAHVVSIRPDGIQAKVLAGDVYIPWSTVTAAWWQATYLCVRSKAPDGEVWLPYTLGSRQSELLMLAVIRFLRSAGVPQAVPLPTFVSSDPDILKQTACSGARLGTLQRAFLSTVDPSLSKRIRSIYLLQVLSIMLAMFAAAAVIVANVPGLLSQRIFSTADTRCFVPSSCWALVPLMLGAMASASEVVERLGYRLAGPHGEIWREYCKVGAGKGRSCRILLWVCIAIGALAVLSIPLFVCCYTRLTDTGIVMNRPLQFREQFYPWRSVDRIEIRHSTTLDHGKTRAERSFAVRFSDHSDWAIREDGAIWEKDKAAQAIDFVLRTSHRPIVEHWEQ